MTDRLPTPLELWGGIECTVNRVGDAWFDQLEFSGHATRPDDLDRIAGLGITGLRYPVLWEHVMPRRLGEGGWRRPDERLARIAQLGMRPIVTLLHHGSGPTYTSLADPDFPHKFARYARAVAERYPWVADYTPINEPLTTARFSGLYGLWHPHARDNAVFTRCLLNQVRGIQLAMREIRAVQPAARLIHTEDLGAITSVPRLAYQAAYENERRWLSMDLVTGRVVPGHPLRTWLLRAGAGMAELERIAADASPPDLIGINHYITSNRHLDDDLTAYPEHYHGGNARHAYADVEAVRVADAPQTDRAALLRLAWERYGLPVALTEAHLGGPREDQARWLVEAWSAAQSLREAGVDVRAVTAWALLGSFDWHCLVTSCEGRYEPGAFDVRSDPPRETMVAATIRAIAAQGAAAHPVLRLSGWWRRAERSHYPRPEVAAPAFAVVEGGILITGGRGTLGRAFARICRRRGLPYTRLAREDLDIADADSVRAALDRHRPWAVVNAAGYVRVDDAESDRERCRRENVTGPRLLAQACAERGVPCVTFSSDLVFGGDADHFTESSPTRPLNYYGLTKREAEEEVLAAAGRNLVIRTGALFGPWDPYNFVSLVRQELAAGRPFQAADDVWVSPTYVPDLVHAALDLLLDGEQGIWHLANDGAVTWAGLARSVATLSGHAHDLVVGRPADAMGWLAQRPLRSVLRSQRASLLGPLDIALAHYFDATPPVLQAA